MLAAIDAVLAAAGLAPSAVGTLAHGMTVATNALLEGNSARAALLATDGFTDVVELARQNRPALYRLQERGPAPLIGPELRWGVRERMTPAGPLLTLSREEAERLAVCGTASRVDAVAVVLLHAYRHPEHERAIADAFTRLAPGVSVHLSSELVGTFREYERAATTELDAALSPLLAGYLRRLADACDRRGLPAPGILASQGGLIDLETAAAHAALTVLSGPAGGAAGAAHVARGHGLTDALCLDMGGTSTDVCLIADGVVAEHAEGRVAGRPVALPTLAIHTVGAGGGSIAWADAGGALRVGPRSAGADPGPAAYGRGGVHPTVTDANVLLGLLDPAVPLAGGIRLDADAAQRAIAGLAGELGLSTRGCARGIRTVVTSEIAGALSAVTLERGVDPRALTLIAFGGAGGLHAAEVAEALGIGSVLVPGEAGVLAALGLVVAPARRDRAQSVLLSGAGFTDAALRGVVDELAAQAAAGLGGVADRFTLAAELRYVGQSFELPVRADPAAVTAAALTAAFVAAHVRRYGFSEPDGEVELVTVRVSAHGPAPELPGRGLAARVRHHHGPTVIRRPETTVVVPAGWTASEDASGTVALAHASGGRP